MTQGMAEKADLHRRPQRVTVKDILRTAVNLEKKTMGLYMRFAQVFQPQERAAQILVYHGPA